MNLRQITESVIETCQYGVIVELLRGQDYYNEKQKVLYERDESGAMQHEAERDSWAMVRCSALASCLPVFVLTRTPLAASEVREELLPARRQPEARDADAGYCSRYLGVATARKYCLCHE